MTWGSTGNDTDSQTLHSHVIMFEICLNVYNSDLPDRVVGLPHAAAPRAGLAAVDVERGLISSAVTLRTRLVVILKNLDS